VGLRRVTTAELTRADAQDNFGLYQATLEPLPPVDWFPAPPDFVGIGVQKAGTTWWYRLIEAHPDVCSFHFMKERHYFTRFGHRAFDDGDAIRYSQLFSRPPGTLGGEWTPGYITQFWVPPLLARAAPDAKLIMMMREPIARYLSGVRHGLHMEELRLDIAQRDSFVRGRYFSQLEMFLEYFPADRILLLQYEKCRANPLEELRRTYRFLGLRDDFVPPNLTVSYNEISGPRFVAPQHVLDTLVHLYRPDVRSLKETWPDLDLAAWAPFSDLG
jgi:hypothetical protein